MSEPNLTKPMAGRGWHSTTFRWLTIYSVIFAVAVVILVGGIMVAATNVMESDTDDVLSWQLLYFTSLDDGHLGPAVARRLEHEHMHANYFGLFTADGRLIAGDIATLPNPLEPDSVGGTVDGLPLRDGDISPRVRVMAKRLSGGRVLLVARDLTHIIRIRDTIIRLLILGGVLAIGVSVITGLMLSVRQLRRVRDIRRVTQEIAQGNLQTRLPVGGRDELDLLSQLVNHMLDDIERLMLEVKDACDGIAHDLRTPLSHVRTLLTQIADRTAASQDAGLEQMLELARSETDRLLLRFRALMRIAEIGTLQRRGGFAPLNLAALVGELAELYEPLADSESVVWQVDIKPVREIRGDRELLFEAFSNLIGNAIKFVGEGGRVALILFDTPNGPQFNVIDNGPGIRAEERSLVMQPFYRSEQTAQFEGSGLGLGIVAAVLRVHDFTLSISDATPDPVRPGACMAVQCWPRTLA